MMRSEDFPIFRKKGLVYLDSAASTQKPAVVIDAVCDFCSTSYANVHRGVYPLSEKATSLYEDARCAVSQFINAGEKEIVFVRSATEAINLIAYSWGRTNLSPGDAVLTTIMEHHSNFVPWQQIASQMGADFRVVGLGRGGVLDLDEVEKELKRGVKLFAFSMASNVLGLVNPVRELTDLAHRYGTLVVVDGAQAIAHMPVDVKELGVDFFAFSGHKVYGPTSIGALYGKKKSLEALPPFLFGGEMISEVHIDRTSFNEVPYKFEAGTPPITEAIGLAAALDYVESVGLEAIFSHEKELAAHAYMILDAMPGVTIYGPPEADHTGVIAFNLEGVHPHDVAGLMGDVGICIRAGHHCAQPLHEYLGIPATARLSIGIYNTLADIEKFAGQLEKIKQILRRAS